MSATSSQLVCTQPVSGRKTGDVAQWLERRNSNTKTLDLIPWRGRVKGSFFLSLRVNSCADLFVPNAPFARTARTQICAHVKDPLSISRKRVGLTTAVMVTQKQCIYTRLVSNSNWVARLCRSWLSSGKGTVISAWEKFPLGQNILEKKERKKESSDSRGKIS